MGNTEQNHTEHDHTENDHTELAQPERDQWAPETSDTPPALVEPELTPTGSTAISTAVSPESDQPSVPPHATPADDAAAGDLDDTIAPSATPASAPEHPVAPAPHISAVSKEIAHQRDDLSPEVRRQYVVTTPQAQVENTAVLESAHVSATEPVLATADPGDAAFLAPTQRIIYVEAPPKPTTKSNRGAGALIAVLSSVLYAIVFGLIIFSIFYATTGSAVTSFVGQQSFFVPVVLFAVGFVVLALIVNRGGWWAFVLGSVFVGVFVYIGTICLVLLLDGVIASTPDQASAAFARALLNPLVIISGLLARETAVWLGLVISRRGKRVKARNVEAMNAYKLEAAHRQAAYAQAAATAVS